MIFVILGLIIGVIIGFNTDFIYNPIYTVYISLIVLAIINTILNIFVENIKQDINSKKCLIMLIADIFIALLIGFIGEQLGLPLYLAVIFSFGNNIYTNINKLLHRYLDKKNI